MREKPSQEQLHTRLLRLFENRRFVAVSGILYRSVSPMFTRSGDVISGVGSQEVGGRWNVAGTREIYASDLPETALAETFREVRYFGLHESKALPRTFVAIEFHLSVVLDLADGNVRQRLGVSHRRLLLSDWRTAQNENRRCLPQRVADAARQIGFEGVWAPSAARAGARNLVVYPDSLRASSRITVLGTERSPSG